MERIKQLEAVMDFVIDKYEKEDVCNISEDSNEILLKVIQELKDMGQDNTSKFQKFMSVYKRLNVLIIHQGMFEAERKVNLDELRK